MTDEEKAKELTIKNVTDGKNKYFSWGFYKGCVVGLEYNNKQIAELEKENAELKGIKDIATLIRANNDTVITLMQLNNMLVSKNQQLTKAKGLLKWFVWYFKEGSPNLVPYKHKVKEAEQFLKESE